MSRHALFSEIGVGTGGHTIQDEGTARTARAGLNFIGANVSATDNSGSDRTDVTITGEASGAVATHSSDTTVVHGLSDTNIVVRGSVHNGSVYVPAARDANATIWIWIGPTDPAGAAANNDMWIPTS